MLEFGSLLPSLDNARSIYGRRSLNTRASATTTMSGNGSLMMEEEAGENQ